MDADALRSLRNFYYLGLTQAALKEAEEVGATNPESEALARVFFMRALLESSPAKVFQRIQKNAPTALQAVKLLATYRTASQDNKELVFGTLSEWLETEDVKDDETLQIVAAQIYLAEEDYKSALQLVINDENLEKMALCVEIYLRINRLDLAEKVARQMQDIDDDDVLTQLSLAWVYIRQGGDKVTEASFLLQELVDKFGPSARALNGLAVCQIALKNYAPAFQLLKQSRDFSIKSGGKPTPETLVNCIVCLSKLRKSPELIAKITSELRDLAPDHPWLRRKEQVAALFDKHAAQHAV